jgi:hypothetical protein
MEYITDWRTVKTTTDKLVGALNDVSDDGYDVHTVQYVGGRDWVIVAERDVPATPPEMGTYTGQSAAEHLLSNQGTGARDGKG